MPLQAPTGVKARFAPGWAYLTIEQRNGHSIEVEWSVDGEPWHEGAKFGTEFLVPMYADPRRTNWRARYKRGENVSAWTTGQVGSPDFFQEDGHDDKPDPQPPTPQPPNSPTNARVSAVGTDAATVSWDAPASGAPVDHYHLTYSADGGVGQYTSTVGTSFRLTGLTPGAHYMLDVFAVGVDNDKSRPASVIFTTENQHKPDPDPDPTPQPVATPKNVRAHCIAPTSTKVEWDRDPVVHEYEVWLDASVDAAQRTQDTLVSVKGLTPLTQYTAHVVAHTADGRKSAPGSIVFKTGSAEPAPDPDPDVDVNADWPAPDLMVWPVENGKVRATWTDPDDGTKPKSAMGYAFWHVSVDQKTWFFTKDREFEFEVAPGAEVMFSVYGVWDNTLTAIATKGAAL